ncbi:hypothetical protein SLEP1_g3102 [Rubroshorea leprosula]|uniref:Uncharacterized protein n=1 Tax=Rubroshorea leprosula TaxID=152421 RepID=A0AAV5HQ24_9ROSI|nr:hypothetical protein SLEP1_g3102 [Rubroshorea leprosula]
MPGFGGTQAFWVRVWVRTEPSMPGFGGTQACWVRVWVCTEPSMPRFGGTQHAWVRFLANPGVGFARNPIVLGLHQTQHAWVWWNPARLGLVPCEPRCLVRLQVLGLKSNPASGGFEQPLSSWVLGFVSNPAAVGSNIY